MMSCLQSFVLKREIQKLIILNILLYCNLFHAASNGPYLFKFSMKKKYFVLTSFL